MLYRRLSDPSRRPARRAWTPAIVASGGSEQKAAPAAASPLLEELQRVDQGAVDAPQQRDADEAPGKRQFKSGRGAAIVVAVHARLPQATPTASSTVSGSM